MKNQLSRDEREKKLREELAQIEAEKQEEARLAKEAKTNCILANIDGLIALTQHDRCNQDDDKPNRDSHCPRCRLLEIKTDCILGLPWPDNVDVHLSVTIQESDWDN